MVFNGALISSEPTALKACRETGEKKADNEAFKSLSTCESALLSSGPQQAAASNRSSAIRPRPKSWGPSMATRKDDNSGLHLLEDLETQRDLSLSRFRFPPLLSFPLL